MVAGGAVNYSDYSPYYDDERGVCIDPSGGPAPGAAAEYVPAEHCEKRAEVLMIALPRGPIGFNAFSQCK